MRKMPLPKALWMPSLTTPTMVNSDSQSLSYNAYRSSPLQANKALVANNPSAIV